LAFDDAGSTATVECGGGPAAVFDLSGEPAPAPAAAAPVRALPVGAELAFRADPTATAVQTLLDGTALHRTRLDSAITATAASTDCSLVLAGTVAGVVYAMKPLITLAQANALLCAEQTLLADAPAPAERVAELYQSAGSATFAVSRLRHLVEIGLVDGPEADRLITAIARRFPHLLQADPALAFEAAESFARTGGPEDLEEAVRGYQSAASSVQFRAAALHAAAGCFRALGAAAAADASYRAAAASGPDEREQEAVYDLARRLEDRGLPWEAAARYEMLLPWGADYRDIRTRHARCSTAVRSYAPRPPDPPSPESARACAPDLLGVVQHLDEVGLLPTAKRTIDEYDAAFYGQFENTAVQDSVKKRLEMIQLLGTVDVAEIGTSLDVGSGTLRYPRVLARHGVRAYGIDLRDTWIRANVEDEWKRRFAVADGTALPFRDRCFDLITCMMGTVNHLTAAQRARFFAESLRTLRPGGRLVVSAWDPGCVFQSMLSFYSAAESAELREQLTPREQLAGEIEAAGFAETRVTRFCTFPDWMVMSGGQAAEGAAALAVLVELDQLHLRRTPEIAGQLFLLCARRSPGPGRPTP
jgi:SAM-dependent methyltransferase